MKYRIMLLAAVCAAFISCNKEVASPAGDPEGELVTICVNAGGDSGTKVIGSLNTETKGIHFTWESGDQIKVTRGGESSNFTLKSGAGTVSAVFEGTMPGSGETFDVQFPVDEPDLTSQEYSANALPHNKMMATDTGCTLGNAVTLSTSYAALRLNLYGKDMTVSKIVVTNISSTEETKPSYTLSCGTSGVTVGADADNATPFFIVVPAGTYKFTAKVYSTEAILGSFTPTNEQTFTAGKVKNMPAKEVTANAYEAKINSTNYPTLAEAITAANATSDATIELLKNVTVSDQTLSISASMTINMDGFSITCTKPIQSGTSYPFLVTTSDISLTFKNGVIIDGASANVFDSFIAGASMGFFGSATYTLNLANVDFGVFDTSGSCTATFRTKGNCTLFSGIASAYFNNARIGTTFSVINNDNYGTGNITVTGGKYVVNGYNADGNFGFCFADGTNSFKDVTIDITSTVAGSSCVCGPATLKNCCFTSDQCAVSLTSGSGTTVDGGTYNGNVAAVQVKDGTVTINSGTFTSAGYVLQTDGCYESGGAYNAYIYVNNGQFKGAIAKKATDKYNTIELKGGIYSDNPSAYKASGYSVRPNPDESTGTEYPYMVAPFGGGLGDINKTVGSW